MIIHVKVKPSSREELLEKTSENEYLAYVKEPPLDGKANKALIKMLCKEFKVNFRQIKIKNPSSRNKVVGID